MEQFDRWHKTRPGLLIFGVIEFLMAYGFLSLAIDRGSWWWYLLTVILLMGGVQSMSKLVVKVLRNGSHQHR